MEGKENIPVCLALLREWCRGSCKYRSQNPSAGECIQHGWMATGSAKLIVKPPASTRTSTHRISHFSPQKHGTQEQTLSASQ